MVNVEFKRKDRQELGWGIFVKYWKWEASHHTWMMVGGCLKQWIGTLSRVNENKDSMPGLSQLGKKADPASTYGK